MMDAVGLRFMAFGNHDFDYGAERTRELPEMVRFPMRGADVLDRTTGQPFLGDPTMVVDTGGIRVGLLAPGYHNTPLTTDPDNVASLSFTDGIEAARRHVPEIRVADGKLARVRATNHTLWSADVPANPQATQIIEDLRAPFRERLTEVIATARDRIGRRYRSESPFDRLVGDILRTETGAEVALPPGVGYGVSIGPGPVTREDLYALLPHPSRVVTLKLTGAQLREVLGRSAANQKPERPQERVGGLVQTAGLRWSVDLIRPRGQRVDTLEVD